MRVVESERQALERTVGKIESVVDTLEKIHGAIKDTNWPDAIAGALPWAGLVIESAAEAFGPVKFILSLSKKLTEVNDPNQLTWMAATLAYQHALQKALLQTGGPSGAGIAADMAADFKRLDATSTESMDTFGFDYALLHPFTRDQDRAVDAYARAMGYTPAQRRELLAEIHARFVSELKDVVTDPSIKSRFDTVVRRMELGAEEARSHAWLAAHRAWLRQQYREMPVLGREAFSLADVYIETEAGHLTWEQIDAPRRKTNDRCDPFNESAGGRHPLVETVVSLLGSHDFKDAIVVQGVAGAGKSAFTLRLADRLLEDGLRPIRVRLRDLRRFESDVYQALGEAILIEDVERTVGLTPPADPLLDGRVFDTVVDYGAAKISPYVLLLDGWDELTIAGSRSFRDRLKELLQRLRETLLRRLSKHPIRVVLTGRPSPDLEGSTFLLPRTPILTLRPVRPDQLQDYARRLAAIVETPRITSDGWTPWRLDLDRCQPAFDAYTQWFESPTVPVPDQTSDRSPSGSMDVLGLPLLALLAFRLLAEWPGPPEALWEQPTTLYRSLIDLTVQHAGKGASDLDDTHVVHITGDRLRGLLRGTAAAITAHGVEAIPFAELQLRLDEDDLLSRVSQETSQNPLHALVVAFYFKGGHPELGCEFLHKSFREYLFAEQIVETLKAAANDGIPSYPPLKDWWRDFDPTRDRAHYNLSRSLGRLLGPHWLSSEVRTHLRVLLEWEIQRSSGEMQHYGAGRSTTILPFEKWRSVRDILADLWAWWADGLHLRLCPNRPQRGRSLQYEKSYTDELIETWVLPRVESDEPVPVPRPTTIDAHLGDGLCELASVVHYQVARAEGWDGRWPQGHRTKDREYQTVWTSQNYEVRLFSPSGHHPEYFFNFCARINAAGFRPRWPFPGGMDLRGVTLQNCRLWGLGFFHTDLSWSNLRKAGAQQAIFYMTRLDHAVLAGTGLHGADIEDVRSAAGLVVANEPTGVEASIEDPTEALTTLRRLSARSVRHGRPRAAPRLASPRDDDTSR